MRAVVLTLRLVQLITALATLVTAVAVVHWFNMNSGKASPAAFNILVAVPIYAFISLFYLEAIPRIAPSASHPIPSLFFEASTVIFFLAGCGASAHFVARLEMCVGLICGAAKAAPVFAGLAVPCWIGTTVLLASQIFTHGFRRPSASRPAMSQA
ncbi:hypothetical protein jhhlp_001459 [Lomentospora prolificans]|uniref:MARVEL domain-containing protein n=1 Tax=Lomentospora prolificans TaxID=41688 RepID=A0A2N3NIC7_9PEZI|nr:hypothetical protein jhhlp_001459 [Lomentospora prolificans]